MPIRICSYNIEWFNHLFNKDNSLKTGTKEEERFAAIAAVLKHIKPDFIGIVEAPNTSRDLQESTVTRLENFAQYAGLPVNRAVMGYISPGTQELAALYNPDKLIVEHKPGGSADLVSNPPFNAEFRFDTDDDNIKEVYKHYRPPLELEVGVIQKDFRFKAMVVHAKTKGIFKSTDILHWERESRRNHLKLFAECEWIRRRVEEWFSDGSEVMVMGDINDGPGMDYYELKYGHSAMEIIMGDLFEPEKILHSWSGRPKWTADGWKPSSVRYKDIVTEKYVRVLIDHILVSRGIPVYGDSPHTIWNPYENDVAMEIKSDLTRASDHFPITLDLDL